MLRDLGRRDRFHPVGTERLMGIAGGIPAAKEGRTPPRSSGTQQRPYKLNTQVFFQLMQGVEEQNEDYYYFLFHYRKYLF